MSGRTFAPIVRRRRPTWPSRMANYFDCTEWGGGLYRVQGAPGAVKLNGKGQMLNLRSGEVYHDERFNTEKGTTQ